jgi:hypothetical protein
MDMFADNYSADVALWLTIGEQSFALAQVGDSDLIVRDECSVIPPGPAELHISVDDTRDVRTIYLPNGIPGPRQPVAYF